MSTKYRRIPFTTDAFQLTEEFFEKRMQVAPKFIEAEFRQANGSLWFGADGKHVAVETNRGSTTARVGDWIVRSTSGELYSCADEVFRTSYEFEEESTKRDGGLRTPDGCAPYYDTARGDVVIATEDFDADGADVRRGMKGVCFQEAGFHEPNSGPMVRWENGGACNAYADFCVPLKNAMIILNRI